MATANFGHVKGADGQGVPAGGANGSLLRKLSNADNDTGWQDVLGIPHGGTGATSAGDARAALGLALRVATDPATLGLTVTTSTTLEQVLAAMPDGTQLTFAPAPATTSNLTPAASRYGTLTIVRLSATRIYCMCFGAYSAQTYRCSVTYDSGAGTWTAGAWTALITGDMIANDQNTTDATKVLSALQGNILGTEIDDLVARSTGIQAWSGGAWGSGSITVPGSANGRLAVLTVAGGTGLQFIMRVHATMCGSIAYYTGTEVREVMVNITTSGTTWTCGSFARLTLGQGAANGTIVTSSAFNISSVYLY